MPSYIQRTFPIYVSASMCEGIEEDNAWEYLTQSYPLFDGTYHSEAHDIFTEQVFNTNAQLNGRDDEDESTIYDHTKEIGALVYVENLEHDEETKTVSWNIVSYYKDQECLDASIEYIKSKKLFNNHERDGDELPEQATVAVVDFHRPYPD
jgi:hypothetical protein